MSDQEDIVDNKEKYLERLRKLHGEARRWALMMEQNPAETELIEGFQKCLNDSLPVGEVECQIYQVVRHLFHTAQDIFMRLVRCGTCNNYIFFTDGRAIADWFHVSEYVYVAYKSDTGLYVVSPRRERGGGNFQRQDYGGPRRDERFRDDRPPRAHNGVPYRSYPGRPQNAGVSMDDIRQLIRSEMMREQGEKPEHDKFGAKPKRNKEKYRPKQQVREEHERELQLAALRAERMHSLRDDSSPEEEKAPPSAPPKLTRKAKEASKAPADEPEAGEANPKEAPAKPAAKKAAKPKAKETKPKEEDTKDTKDTKPEPEKEAPKAKKAEKVEKADEETPKPKADAKLESKTEAKTEVSPRVDAPKSKKAAIRKKESAESKADPKADPKTDPKPDPKTDKEEPKEAKKSWADSYDD